MRIGRSSPTSTLAILELNGRLTAESGSALCEAVSSALSEGRRQIVLNLTGVRVLDASGLGGLATTLRLVRAVQGELRIVAGSAAVHELLTRTHLARELVTCASEGDAVASLETTATSGSPAKASHHRL